MGVCEVFWAEEKRIVMGRARVDDDWQSTDINIHGYDVRTSRFKPRCVGKKEKKTHTHTHTQT